jgi:hypothetical protein
VALFEPSRGFQPAIAATLLELAALVGQSLGEGLFAGRVALKPADLKRFGATEPVALLFKEIKPGNMWLKFERV